jgi:hypothetical protein
MFEHSYSIHGFGPMVGDRVLSEFQETISSAPDQESIPVWIRTLSSVETTECDLLVPKVIGYVRVENSQPTEFFSTDEVFPVVNNSPGTRQEL